MTKKGIEKLREIRASAMTTSTTNTAPKPTLRQHLASERQQYPAIPDAISHLLCVLAAAGQEIGRKVSQVSLLELTGTYGTHNSSGDVQQQLDMLAHDCLISRLTATQTVCAIISEEAEELIQTSSRDSLYTVALDPLDGSLNIDVNAPVGTLFSIYQRVTPCGAVATLADVLQAGDRQIAAGYLLYGTSTMFVYTAGHGVHGFTYDLATEEFRLTHPTIQVPQTGKIYAINDAHFSSFPNAVQQYVHYCRECRYTARYMGALVADFHRNLLQGGIYLYPPTSKNPTGKLRLLLECNALALIAAQAGGAASNGQQAILSTAPHTIHQRTPLYIGSASMVAQLLSYGPCTSY
ncbi:MAG: class 1 fructose-bisphosphatase [Bacteroidota bacterium]